jgi:hypothetical protein
MVREKHMNLYTIFKRAQLFERFRALEWRRFQPNKVEQRFAPKTVDALVTQILDRDRTIARKRDRIARKVNRVIVPIDDYLNLVRRGSVSRVLERVSRCDDVHLRIGAERLDQAVEQGGFDKRLVALDINNDVVSARVRDDLGDSVGPALMLFRGYRDLGTPIERRVSDAHVVCCDNEGVQLLRAPTLIPNVPKKRLISNEMERFSRESR